MHEVLLTTRQNVKNLREFLELNWLSVQNRYLQFIVSYIFKFCNNQCPDYFTEVFYPVEDNGNFNGNFNKTQF